jgi:L-lactate dehydrogenase
MKVAIIGAGMVGSAAGFSIASAGIAQEIVFVDKSPALARAQAEDIAHAVPFGPACVLRHGGYDQVSGADLIVIAAGVAQQPGETRLNLLSRNRAVFADVCGQITRHAPDAVLLVATNPVDIMTQITQDLTGFPARRVIGSGTILDTARFRALLGTHFGISPQSVHAYVLGEHGDSEVLAWSSARAGSLPLTTFAAQIAAPITAAVRGEVDSAVRNAAYSIINGKGATWFGIGAGLAAIARAVLRDEQTVLSVSMVTHDVVGVRDVALSLPRIVGAGGIHADLMPDLSPDEDRALHHSATILRRTWDDLGQATA